MDTRFMSMGFYSGNMAEAQEATADGEATDMEDRVVEGAEEAIEQLEGEQ